MATKPLLKKNTDELQVDCEVASAVIAEYFAFCAKQLSEEKDNDSPNPEKIQALETQLRELKKEKMSIGVANAAVINKALYVYAPLLKKRAAV